MNANAQAWVAALRSGEFTQTTGALKDAHGFCCLGVACELYRRAHPDAARWTDSPSGRTSFEAHDHGATGSLPGPVQAWLGIASNSGIPATGSEDRRSLVNMNDTDKLSFDEIAEVVETRWDDFKRKDS